MFLLLDYMELLSIGQEIYTFILFLTSFSSTFTRIMSGPTWTIHLNGITYSKSLHTRPHHFPGPGTIIASIQPVQISNSMSSAQPNILQLQVFITSFCYYTLLFYTHYDWTISPFSLVYTDSYNWFLILLLHIFLHCLQCVLFKSANLCLAYANFICYFHLCFSIKESHIYYFSFSFT